MILVCAVVSAFQLALLVRAVLSWFPVRRDSIFGQVEGVARLVTEPVLAPIRRALPMLQTSGFDLTFLLLVFAVQFLKAQIGCAGGL